MDRLQFSPLASMKGYSAYGGIGVEINIVASRLDLDDRAVTRDIERAGRRAIELVESAIYKKIIELDPQTAIRAKAEKDHLTSLFDDHAIYVEETQNEYANDESSRPWLIVTTHIGRIKIGWRSHVIEINWEDTIEYTDSANSLFPDECVTMGNKYIHAHDLKDAKRYIKTIMENLMEV